MYQSIYVYFLYFFDFAAEICINIETKALKT